MDKLFKKLLLSFFLMLLAACASFVPQPAETVVTEQIDSTISAQGWRHFPLPGKKLTSYQYGRIHGRPALIAKAGTSASMLRKAVNIDANKLDTLSFSWVVPELIQGADLTVREQDDSPVRIMLSFEGDTSKFSAKNAMLSELALAMTGEPMPYATLMYVWCNKRAPGSVIHNPRTDRIRHICVESGTANLKQWLDYQRHIRADFVKAFGEEPGKLLNIGIMTDSDNTRTLTSGAYGDVRFGRLAGQ